MLSVFVHMCLCVSACVCAYVRVHNYMDASVCVYLCVSACVSASVHAYMCMYLCACVCVCVYLCVSACVSASVRAYMCMHMYVCVLYSREKIQVSVITDCSTVEYTQWVLFEYDILVFVSSAPISLLIMNTE